MVNLFGDADASHMKPLRVYNGAYLISHREAGRFRLSLWTSRKPEFLGRRAVSLLRGAYSPKNFYAVGWYAEDPEPLVEPYTLYRGASLVALDGYGWSGHDGLGMTLEEKKIAIWLDLVVRGNTDARHGFWHAEGYRVEITPHCIVCNTVLDNPESARLGIGPTCRKNLCRD